MANRYYWEWDCGLNPHRLRDSFRTLNPISLSELDLWEKALFGSRSSAWSYMGLSGSGLRSKISNSSAHRQCGVKESESNGLKRWQVASPVAPEGTPLSVSSSGAELNTALEESSMRRTELIKKLWETHKHLDTQTDLLKAKETELQHSQSTIQLLECKQKQLTKALSVAEEEKNAAELSRFEESRHRAELQEKVVKLELDLLKAKSNLGKRNNEENSISNINPQLNRAVPVPKDDYLREMTSTPTFVLTAAGVSASRATTHRFIQDTGHNCRIPYVKPLMTQTQRLKQLTWAKEKKTRLLLSVKNVNAVFQGQHKALNQVEEMKQKLSTSLQTHCKLTAQLSESCSRLGQLELEKGLLSSKSLQLEDSLKEMKTKLSAALSEVDRLVQEKADLHQKMESLKLQLQRAQLGQEGFTKQACELHSELTQAKGQVSRQQHNTVLMKEELSSAKEVNEKLSADMAAATERFQETLKKLHELEAERLIHTSHISALESERLQLIQEKEELMDVFDQGNQDELRDLRQKCYQLRKLQEALECEKQDLQSHCQGLEKKVRNMEVEIVCKEEKLKHLGLELEQQMEELKKVAAHWNERWLDVSMTLQSTQTELEETKKQQQETKEAAGMVSMMKTLEAKLKDSQDQIQSLIQQKTDLEKELCKVKKEAGALERVELDACKQQLDLERSRSQSLQQRLMRSPVSLEDTDGELVQVKTELQNVWDMLKSRDTELEGRQQELHSAQSQVAQKNSEVERLQQRLAEREQELKDMDFTLKNLMSQRQGEKTEAQNRITALEKELNGLKELKSDQELCTHLPKIQAVNFPKAQLEESRTTDQMKQERDHALLNPHQMGKKQKMLPLVTKKQNSTGPDLVDPDHQRRLITEQLKSLFKERELGNSVSPALSRKAASVLDQGPKSQAFKNQLELRQDLDAQQGSGESTADGPEEAQSEPLAPEKGPQGQTKGQKLHYPTKLKYQQQFQDLETKEKS
ncbi:centriolin-like [Hoplias malabaricus]|uniref:centriolin-like n=1 Tax=Hoplias malabaricus TaxID=27720 RepID=UPI00346290FC